MPESVQLTDLDVITLYSIAVRTASADRDELIATLQADLEWLESGATSREADVDAGDEASEDGAIEDGTGDAGDTRPARRAPVSHDDFFEPLEPEQIVVAPPTTRDPDRPRPPLRRMPATITPAAKKAAAKKTATKKTAVRKAVAKKTVTTKPAAKKAAAKKPAATKAVSKQPQKRGRA